MKKKHRLLKVILLLTASALVVTISISATLAFLTDNTATRENTFHSDAIVKGETIEPYGEKEGNLSGESTVNYSYQPGNQYAKDPLIHNKTINSEVYVGARVDFYIAIIKSGNNPVYWQVPYSLFTQYVDISGFNVGSESGKWEEKAVLTAADENDNAVTAHTDFESALGTQWSKYYVYNDVLKEAGSAVENVDTGTNNDGTYKIGSDDSQTGSMSPSAKTSITSPIFTSVTPSGKITVSNTLPTASGTSQNAGAYTTVLYADGPHPDDVYQCFDFKIVVNGYGVAAVSTDSRDEVIGHLKADIDLPDSSGRVDVTTGNASNTQLKASHS